jgi:hypothetical protein
MEGDDDLWLQAQLIVSHAMAMEPELTRASTEPGFRITVPGLPESVYVTTRSLHEAVRQVVEMLRKHRFGPGDISVRYESEWQSLLSRARYTLITKVLLCDYPRLVDKESVIRDVGTAMNLQVDVSFKSRSGPVAKLRQWSSPLSSVKSPPTTGM